MAIFKKQKAGTTQTSSPSDENEQILPTNKKSKSEITTKQTNTILLIIAFIMLGIFVVGAIFTTNKNQEDIKAINADIPGETTTTTTVTTETFTYISPIVSADPQTVKFDNITVGTESFNSIMVSVANSPIKITDIKFSTQVDGLSYDDDCTQRESITPESNCIINLIWTPTNVENKNIFMLLTYNDPDSEEITTSAQSERGKSRTYKINISLSSKENKAPVETYEEEEEDEFYDDEDEEYEEEEEEEEDFQPATKRDVRNFTNTVAPVMNQTQETTRTVYPSDCKKYASKAYDFSGTFIGWVQTNNDVFAPNCSKVIGSLQEDGMVLEIGTGKLIGKGAVFDKKKSEEKRIELTLPLLEEVMETVTSENFNPSIEDISANRDAVKSGGYGGKDPSNYSNEDLYKADDPLKIISRQKNSLIPFTITEASQLSSMPKDERYVLRQSKPIPAVLNRPIYFGSARENSRAGEDGTIYSAHEGNAVATVERNVYGGDGRTIIIPAGSQLIGTADEPAGTGLQETEKINITWTRLIRPDGAEFNLDGLTAFTGDAQGREGVPGKNDTEYMRDLFIKPLLYSAIPVAMEAIFPSTSSLVTRVKRTDGTYQTIDDAITEEEGDYGFDWNESTYDLNMSSKDKMKAEIQQNWKTSMQKIIDQSAKQSIPFTVAAGTRIMVFLNKDIMLRIEDDMQDALSNAQTEADGGN